MNHWFGHSKIKPIDVDELFYIKVVVGELEYSLMMMTKQKH